MKKLLSGNEAIARGAYEAGIQVATGYPGTPSSEIIENIARHTRTSTPSGRSTRRWPWTWPPAPPTPAAGPW